MEPRTEAPISCGGPTAHSWALKDAAVPGARPLLAPPLTVQLLPDKDEPSEADEEHGGAHDGLPLVCAPVHFCEALLELEAVHWGQKGRRCRRRGPRGPTAPPQGGAPSLLPTTRGRQTYS